MAKVHLYLVSYDDTKSPSHDLRIHWALLLAPPPTQEDPRSFARTSTRYHATRRGGYWAFERRAVECVRSPAMLARVRVGTLDAREVAEVDRILCAVPVDEDGEGRKENEFGEREWDCRVWVEDALRALGEAGILNVKRLGHLDDLFGFTQRFSEGVVRKGLNVGYGIPTTVEYPQTRT